MNCRSLFSMGTNSSGGVSTTPVEWPGFRTTAYHSMGETQAVTKNWMGSLLEEQRDAGGLLYKRNRYYDPKTGQFTQTDPIGLAGGLNTYGFADGDPVSYSDPYGLCSVLTAAAGVALGYGVSRALGAEYTLKDAAVDAALGCVGAVGARTLSRVAIAGRAARAASTADDLAGAASKAVSRVGVGRGSVYGTRVHTAFQQEVRALGRTDLIPNTLIICLLCLSWSQP
jgi:RHS repeat-associated protein